MQRPHRIREKTIMIEAIKINIQLNDTSRPVKANRIHRKSENLICFFTHSFQQEEIFHNNLHIDQDKLIH
jgi:hypothetical protein